MFESIEHEGRLLAIVVSHRYRNPGVTFFTSGDLSQQLAFISHGAGHIIDAHVHNRVDRRVQLTQETLFIRRGRLRVDFYADDQSYLTSRVLETGDAVLLIQGGHGFEVLEDLEMFEVKQGPYTGDHDKTRFESRRPAALDFGRGESST
jgi:mannose-6-phosphate isomerase-like protein (cupin superfamily)